MSNSPPTRLPRRTETPRGFGRTSAAEQRLLLELGKKYRVLAQLGEGGTARVWLAMARGPSGFNKLVVLKTIRGELFDNESVVEMFLEEARIAARLNHPNIVQTNEVFEHDHHPVIVMEYLDGLPLSAILERQRQGSALALAMLLRILSDALAGMHAAHDLKDYDGTPLSVVHRDVSPHNLFVTFAGQVKVLDFGIAQLSTKVESTASGVIRGKLRYIAPEQIHGELPVDCRADVYAMGVILWEIATAERMWSGIVEPVIMKRVLAGELPRAREVNPHIDEELCLIIEKALSPEPSGRYDSALDFQTDLDQYLATLGASLRNRDIGRALSKMFDDVRDERRQTIERQLARSDTLHDIQLSEAPLPELTSFSNVPPPLRRRSFHPEPRTLVLLASLAMLAFAIALFWADPAPLHAERLPEKAPLAAQPEALPAAPERAPDPETVALRVTAFPRTARFSLDGQLLSGNPLVTRVPLDRNGTHQLRVEADGYHPESRTLIYAGDQELVLTLHRVKDVDTPSPAPTRPVRPRTKAPRNAEGPASGKTDCSTPFYYDDRGIKKYRPQCL